MKQTFRVVTAAMIGFSLGGCLFNIQTRRAMDQVRQTQVQIDEAMAITRKAVATAEGWQKAYSLCKDTHASN